jgi:hypothetical protein
MRENRVQGAFPIPAFARRSFGRSEKIENSDKKI